MWALISVPRALVILVGDALVGRHSPQQGLMPTTDVYTQPLAALVR